MPTELSPELQEKVRLYTRFGRNFFLFCREVLGFKDMLSVEEEQLPGYSHEDLCRFLQYDLSPFKLILEPRYTFKSHICTIGKTLWDLTRNDSLRVLFLSDTNDKSEGFLEGVKNHLEGKVAGSKFREIYGDWTVDPKKGVWNQQEISIRPRQIAHVEPTIDTAGIETSKTGKHYDQIIGDDLVSEKNVTTPELMQKVKDVYRKYLSVLKPGGAFTLVGTRWHFGDHYGSIIAEEAERLKRNEKTIFSVYVRKAQVESVYPFSKIGLTKEFIDQQRVSQGTYIWSCLYQNEPTDDETSMFKAKDFLFYDLPPQDLFITCALDPIPPNDSTKGDDAALTVVGTDHEMNLYVLDIMAGRLQPSEQIDALFTLHARWGIRTLAVETNSWQRSLIEAIEVRVAQERKTNPRFRMFHVEPIVRGSTNSKHLDIRGLQPYHERGAIRLKGQRLELLSGTMQKLALQMLQYPNSAHDDVLDSLSMHLRISRAGEVRKNVEELPVTSAAWYERNIWYKQRVKELARIPRWQRPPLPKLAFS